MGVAQNSRATVTQVLVFGSIYQGAICWYHFLEPQPYSGTMIYKWVCVFFLPCQFFSLRGRWGHVKKTTSRPRQKNTYPNIVWAPGRRALLSVGFDPMHRSIAIRVDPSRLERCGGRPSSGRRRGGEELSMAVAVFFCFFWFGLFGFGFCVLVGLVWFWIVCLKLDPPSGPSNIKVGRVPAPGSEPLLFGDRTCGFGHGETHLAKSCGGDICFLHIVDSDLDCDIGVSQGEA